MFHCVRAWFLANIDTGMWRAIFTTPLAQTKCARMAAASCLAVRLNSAHFAKMAERGELFRKWPHVEMDWVRLQPAARSSSALIKRSWPIIYGLLKTVFRGVDASLDLCRYTPAPMSLFRVWGFKVSLAKSGSPLGPYSDIQRSVGGRH